LLKLAREVTGWVREGREMSDLPGTGAALRASESCESPRDPGVACSGSSCEIRGMTLAG
jgi:hypothetical protein